MGIVEQPAIYASKHGPVGFVKGVGKALVGAIVKPVVGVGDAAVLVMNHVSDGEFLVLFPIVVSQLIRLLTVSPLLFIAQPRARSRCCRESPNVFDELCRVDRRIFPIAFGCSPMTNAPPRLNRL